MRLVYWGFTGLVLLACSKRNTPDAGESPAPRPLIPQCGAATGTRFECQGTTAHFVLCDESGQLVFMESVDGATRPGMNVAGVYEATSDGALVVFRSQGDGALVRVFKLPLGAKEAQVEVMSRTAGAPSQARCLVKTNQVSELVRAGRLRNIGRVGAPCAVDADCPSATTCQQISTCPPGAPDSCEGFVQRCYGSAKLGESCHAGQAECGPGLVCNTSGTTPTCAAPGNKGEACDQAGCVAPLVCRALKAGEQPKETPGYPRDWRLACQDPLPEAKLGEDCKEAPCGPGLFCSYLAAKEFECVPQAGEGEPCSQHPDACVPPLSCKPGAPTKPAKGPAWYPSNWPLSCAAK